MKILLPVIYLAAVAAQCFLLGRNLKTPEKARWVGLCLFETVCFLTALVLSFIYSNRTGQGVMPGMTYFTETFYCMAATGAFALLLGGSLLLWLKAVLRRRKQTL